MNRDHAELAVAGLLLLVAAAAVGFVVTYVAGADTQALGLTAGLAFASLAAACVIAGTRVVRSEQRSERRADYSHALEPGPETSELKDELAAGADGITRRRVIGGAAGLAGVALGGALVVPAASLGPDDSVLTGDPWSEGTRLVDGDGNPIGSDVLVRGGFLTAFPEGAEPNTSGAPVVVVRVDPEELELPAERAVVGPAEGISPTRRSARTRVARSTSSAPRSTSPLPRLRRWSARATSRPSTSAARPR